MPTTEFRTALRSAELRVTRPRLAVLEALQQHPHVDTNAVIALVREAGETVSHQAVYDVLRALTEAGLVRRIQPSGTNARYELHHHDNHHHLVCRRCNAIVDVACATEQALCLSASEQHGFEIDEAEVVYWGLCPSCATDPSSVPASALPAPTGSSAALQPPDLARP